MWWKSKGKNESEKERGLKSPDKKRKNREKAKFGKIWEKKRNDKNQRKKTMCTVMAAYMKAKSNFVWKCTKKKSCKLWSYQDGNKSIRYKNDIDNFLLDFIHKTCFKYAIFFAE